MKIASVSAQGFELTNAIREYVQMKTDYIAKLVQNESPAVMEVVVGKTTDHHKKGDIMFCEFRLELPGDTLVVREVEPDVNKAIDKAKDDMARRILDRKEKKLTKERQPRPDKAWNG